MKKFISIFVLSVLFLSPFHAYQAEAAADLTKDPNYKTIYQAMIHLKSQVKVNYNGNTYKVFQKVLEDHPEIFYVSSSYRVSYYGSNGTLKITYLGSTKTIKSQMASLNKKVDTIYKGSKSKKTTKDKIKYFHDYIIDHAKYDYSNYQKGTIPDRSYNAYGVLVKGVGVCQGYAESMQILLNKAKITNYFVVGSAGNGSSWESHAWNLVKVGSKYYHVDTTWDDPITISGKQMKTYDYFMINDSKMTKDHIWTTEDYPKASE